MNNLYVFIISRNKEIITNVQKICKVLSFFNYSPCYSFSDCDHKTRTSSCGQKSLYPLCTAVKYRNTNIPRYIEIQLKF